MFSDCVLICLITNIQLSGKPACKCFACQLYWVTSVITLDIKYYLYIINQDLLTDSCQLALICSGAIIFLIIWPILHQPPNEWLKIFPPEIWILVLNYNNQTVLIPLYFVPWFVASHCFVLYPSDLSNEDRYHYCPH